MKVVEEGHTQTGGKHLHVIVAYEKAKTISTHIFDFNSKHPSIERVRNIMKCINYLKKGKVVYEEGKVNTMHYRWQDLLKKDADIIFENTDNSS